jgi:hypothetical protein
MAPATYTYPGPLGGLRDAAAATPAAMSTITVPSPTIVTGDPVTDAANAAAASIAATPQEHQDRMFKLTIISTAVVGLSALVATLRTWKQLQRDEALFNARLR